MHPLRLLSAAGQVAAYLRTEIKRGRWRRKMPGVGWLASELGVNHKTVDAALRQLEKEMVLEGQGGGRSRLIIQSRGRTARPMRVGIFHYEPSDRLLSYFVELQHALVEAGHTVISPSRTLTELRMDVAFVKRAARRTGPDAWVVASGSKEVLEWFSSQPAPTLAIFGRQTGLPIAGSRIDKANAYAAATRHLIELGHQRIVLLARRNRRLPEPGGSERAFLDTLKAHGLKLDLVAGFHLPEWEETREGLQHLLGELFRFTPPTAMIIDEASFFAATQQFLAGRCIRVPEEVSLICTDPDPTFAWCTPSIAHMRWDSMPVVRRIVRWAAAVSRGRKDLRQTVTPVEFIPGGTIGPAPAE